MNNMLQLPTSILGLADITVEKAEINNSGEFIVVELWVSCYCNRGQNFITIDTISFFGRQ